jgi:hypothetical protein
MGRSSHRGYGKGVRQRNALTCGRPCSRIYSRVYREVQQIFLRKHNKTGMILTEGKEKIRRKTSSTIKQKHGRH